LQFYQTSRRPNTCGLGGFAPDQDVGSLYGRSRAKPASYVERPARGDVRCLIAELERLYFISRTVAHRRARETRSIAGLELVVSGPTCHFLDSSKLRPQSAGSLDRGCGQLNSRCRRASVASSLIAWTADRSVIACNCHSSQPAPVQQSCRPPIKTRCVPCRTIMMTSAKCV
jgi:hypothetical protein